MSKIGSLFDLLGERIKGLFFGQFGIKLTYRREIIIILLIISAVLIFAASLNWLIWLGIFLMTVNILLWIIVIFSWTLDPLLEASAWGRLAYFHELKNEVINFSKINLLQKFLARFFSTFIILILGYAFIYFGLQKITNPSFVFGAEQQGLTAPVSILDFVYYSAITIATVGYGDIYPIHPFAKIFVLTEVICGALIVIFLISSFTSISIHLSSERQQALVGEIEKEIKDIDAIFSELKQLYKES